MKVGIMSMHRIKNYGSFLQAYGLKMTLENLGHEVEFVDYKIEKPIVPTDNDKGVINRSAREVYHMIRRVIFKKKTFSSLFDMNYFAMLGLSERRKYRTIVDVLVIGSDEVFNCLQSNPNVGYSKELFGKDNNASKVISYAASCGYSTVKGLKNYGINSEVGELLRAFSSISVRDNNSFEVVKELTGIPPVINVDPVIISNFDQLIPPQSELNNYILIYAYGSRINSEVEIKAIKRFAKKYNKKLVSVGAHQKWTDVKIEADPFELLAYVKGADYVITDTFHGSIYSIKYNRPFATIIRESNKQKLRDLLQRFSVEDREVRDMDKLEEILQRSINFERVNRIISMETEKSIKYLKENIRVNI
ncbi:polysaccharide pyruvyl transferase family protein [Desulfosporosinus fructosivorans]|uniref:Polysaccharide pyruvyl transferase family protein n=1 Tax=Desulfosporosinus fructosivorans TaxID=2018669 RepID=A0A4Z0QWH4_9FIRM|nr:polysaccharide pyruvyl transferase family protein [Desulfosporosinus fructosivorans]TGE34864.1 polysaccharide pyruvyl transferase family protein [Desulfosporosinus fructosivorans]